MYSLSFSLPYNSIGENRLALNHDDKYYKSIYTEKAVCK